MDILEALRDLHKQATEERSHYYTGKVVLAAIQEIERLRAGRDLCVDCGTPFKSVSNSGDKGRCAPCRRQQ